jgi:hypothetical protein
MKILFLPNNREEDSQLRIKLNGCPYLQVTIDDGRYVVFQDDCNLGSVLSEEEFERKLLQTIKELLEEEK